MADKPVKKITKTINGTEYGLQVESAIRDSAGNVINETYVDLKTGDGAYSYPVYNKPFAVESTLKVANTEGNIPTGQQYVLDGKNGKGFKLQDSGDIDKVVNLISANGSETTTDLAYTIDGQEVVKSKVEIGVGDSFLGATSVDLTLAGKNTLFIGNPGDIAENAETGNYELTNFSRPAVITSGTIGATNSLSAESIALISDIPTSYNDLTDKVSVVSGDETKLEITQTANTFTITPKGSGESNQWIEFGTANQTVPSSSLVVGGIFFEEQ